MSAVIFDKPLTNLQLELIKLFSLDLSEEQLMEVKQMLSKYFAEKASDEMDKLWEKNGWDNETMDSWLKGE
ncbi:MAG: hypothetical protein AAFN81_26940 [Bacteroidota bacterium]